MQLTEPLQDKIPPNDTFFTNLVLKKKNIGDNVDDLIFLKVIYIK